MSERQLTERQVMEAIAQLDVTLQNAFELVTDIIQEGDKIPNIKNFSATVENFNNYIDLSNRYSDVCFNLAYLCKCEFQVRQLQRILKDTKMLPSVIAKTKLHLEQVTQDLIKAKESLNQIKDSFEVDIKIYNSYSYMSSSTQYNKMLTQ